VNQEPTDDHRRAADLLERLLVDAAFRADFRRDPAAACQAYGLEGVSSELAVPGSAFQTLEVRESKSALAGMLMAAAAEGVVAVHLIEHAAGHGGGAANVAHVALNRASVRALPAVPPAAVPATPVEAVAEPVAAAAVGTPGGGDLTAALLADPRLHLDPAALNAFESRGVDPRVDELLLAVTREHEVTIGAVHGPGAFDIVAVDGRPVGPSNVAARDLAQSLASIDPSARPAAIATPWNIGGGPYATGPEHQGHIHVAFDAAAAAAVGVPAAMPSPVGEEVVHEAARFIGKPYVWGGESPNTGFDCSGLVQYSYRQLGIDLPRTTWDQIGQGTAVQWGHFQPGDLIFSNFEGPGAGASHVVIYAGHGEVIAAPHTGGHVEYEPVDWFKANFVGARRVIPGGDQMPVAPAAPGVQSLDAAAPAPAGAGPATISAAATGVPSVRPAGMRSTVQFMPVVGAAPEHVVSAVGDMVYPGDGASREQIADWMGAAAAKAGLPKELPVMAALVESGLKNDQYGDRDSLGFFQMRTSIWDEGPYKGFPQNPDLQLRWFIDQAVAVRRERIADGDATFGQDPNSWGDWVADIERPAEQYRGRYALQLGTAQGLLGDS
jgi:cell wall-associated NlpC family hydrolase